MSTFDTSVPHPARRCDYWLGGKDNFAADRESGDAIAAQFPGIRTAVVENRRFLRRAVRMLAEDEGVRQFLDIGTGLPTAGNTHEIAPQARVVYVDNDPLVLTHARALLTGATSYIDADLRDPDTILEQATASACWNRAWSRSPTGDPSRTNQARTKKRFPCTPGWRAISSRCPGRGANR